MAGGVGRKRPATPNDSPLAGKKMKHINAALFPDDHAWPPLDMLWDVLGDCRSEAYLKSQGIIKEYSYAVKPFLGRLGLVICGLHLDQLQVIFCATFPNRVNTAPKAEKVAMSEIFEVLQN